MGLPPLPIGSTYLNSLRTVDLDCSEKSRRVIWTFTQCYQKGQADLDRILC